MFFVLCSIYSGDTISWSSMLMPITSRSILRLVVVATAGSSFVTACQDGPTEPGVEHYVRVRPEWVTGEAAAALDLASGQFRLPAPQALYVGLPSAETLAVAVARLYGDPNQIGNGPLLVQRDRGGPIDFINLRLCSRAIYSVSPFGLFPPPVPGWTRRAWGSHWAIPLCGADGTVQMSVGVPDNAMDVRVVGGAVVFRQFGGGADFNAVGVPHRYPLGLPLTPEEAVATVIKQTKGRVVVRVPAAFNQHDDKGIGQYPLCASWRVEIDQPVVAKAEVTGVFQQAREFFVRRSPSCYSESVALYRVAAEQPTARWLVFPKDTSGTVSTTGLDSVEVELTGPTVFERVTIPR